MFLDRESLTKGSLVFRYLMAGFAVVALSACTSTAPAPESSTPTAAAAASSSPVSPPPTRTSPASSDSTIPGNQSSAAPTFSAHAIKVLEHKIVEDPTGKNVQIKVEAPENTSFLSGTAEAPCEASIIDTASAAPGNSIAASDPSVTYLLRCQDENPTKELTVSTKYDGFYFSFEIPLK